MHIMLVSACQKRAIKKTRAILDSYAPRIGERTWAAPMTQEGLEELYRAMRKAATRQTAVACYLNHGRRSMKLIWTVGAKHRFDEQGRYPVGSTRANQLRPEIPQWLRASSLLAGAAGDMHDIGKASRRFQAKLAPHYQGLSVDQVRHEWLSVKLLQRLRHNGWDWHAAWQNLNAHLNTLKLGERVLSNNAGGISDANEAVDFMMVTHHGLLASGVPSKQPNKPFQKNFELLPTHHAHVREHLPHDDSQFECAGDLPEYLFKDYQHKMQRLQRQSIEHIKDAQQAVDYWSALAIHSRAALIFADHTVSAIQLAPSDDHAALFANTTMADGKRRLNQKLAWHLDQVGQRAARVAVQMLTDLHLGGLSEPSVERMMAKSLGRFVWQNKAAQALQKIQRQHPDQPALVLNIAGTGSGKTRMNLRAMCCLCPENPRVAIALSLRSLTLQTGSALKKSISLNQDELAVVIGDKTVVQLYEAQQQAYADDDENLIEPEIQAWGTADLLPEWLSPLFETRNKQTNQSAQAILTSPILVSTIDYLIAAGEPNQQGHHVKALLRVMSSDLILDEIDGYEPPALVAVLRLIQTAAFYGRRVVCSSATLSYSIAERIEQAFDAGLRLRQAVYARPQSAIYAILDDQVAPKVWLQPQGASGQFQQYYQQHLQQLSLRLADQPIYRLAQLQAVSATATIEDWQHAVLKACQDLHHDHAWQHQSSKKRLSMGLVRVAHVKTAIDLARFLARHYPEARVACYHANDWLMSRHYKEMMLDALLSRQQGSAHLQTHPLIKTLIAETNAADLPLIVVATPVEEVGRDHCFDWGVIDVSSCQSLVQTAGRINRHRLAQIHQPNLRVMQFNAQYCKNNQKFRTQVFCYPGYEPYYPKQNKGRPSVGYPTQDLQQLLPWSIEGQLKIDARLRFAIESCHLAQYDDAGISQFIHCFYQSSQAQGGVFSHVSATALGVAPYHATRLRDPSYKQMFFFKIVDQNLQFFAKELIKNSYGKAIPTDKDAAPHFQTDEHYMQRAWLYIRPQEMIELCNEFNIYHAEGCRVELRQYKDQAGQIDYGSWVYDLAFGLVRNA